MSTNNYVNSKLECPICKRLYAKNYMQQHLAMQHSNIYNTPAWETSRYFQNYIQIRENHKKLWGIK